MLKKIKCYATVWKMKMNAFGARSMKFKNYISIHL